MSSWRRAYGALKDSTLIGLAKITSDFKDLDVAIIKATSHLETPPKERHVRKIFAATSAFRPRADVCYCIHTLGKRLHKTHCWIVAAKTLIVIHRALKEGDANFRDELLSYSQREQIIQLSNFKDDSGHLAWDCSAWVRTYALFLEERLECLRILKYDIESERLVRSPKGAAKGRSRTRDLNREDLLEQLPALQQLLFRLIGCQPEGDASNNYLIQYALTLVLKESFKIYLAINDGIANLVELFFTMSRHDAIKALNIYKRANQQAKNLTNFYEFCRRLDVTRNFHLPTFKQPPSSFLETMEEYARDAPRDVCTDSSKEEESQEKTMLVDGKEDVPPDGIKQVSAEEKTPEEPEKVWTVVIQTDQDATFTKDLVCLDEVNYPAAAELNERNALALAIVPQGATSQPTLDTQINTETSGWELALVDAKSNNHRNIAESKLAGGFDKLLLDSLYDDADSRKQQQQQQQQQATMQYGCGALPNSSDLQDPFAMSGSTLPPTSVQMATFCQQQQLLYLQQQQQYYHLLQQRNLMPSIIASPYAYQKPHYYSQEQLMQPAGSTNPFGNPFVTPTQCTPHQGSNSLI